MTPISTEYSTMVAPSSSLRSRLSSSIITSLVRRYPHPQVSPLPSVKGFVLTACGSSQSPSGPRLESEPPRLNHKPSPGFNTFSRHVFGRTHRHEEPGRLAGVLRRRTPATSTVCDET